MSLFDLCCSFYQTAERQKEVFVKQLRTALELNLPVVIHCRDAEEDCIEVMESVSVLLVGQRPIVLGFQPSFKANGFQVGISF